MSFCPCLTLLPIEIVTSVCNALHLNTSALGPSNIVRLGDDVPHRLGLQTPHTTSAVGFVSHERAVGPSLLDARAWHCCRRCQRSCAQDHHTQTARHTAKEPQCTHQKPMPFSPAAFVCLYFFSYVAGSSYHS